MKKVIYYSFFFEIGMSYFLGPKSHFSQIYSFNMLSEFVSYNFLFVFSIKIVSKLVYSMIKLVIMVLVYNRNLSPVMLHKNHAIPATITKTMMEIYKETKTALTALIVICPCRAQFMLLLDVTLDHQFI